MLLHRDRDLLSLGDGKVNSEDLSGVHENIKYQNGGSHTSMLGDTEIYQRRRSYVSMPITKSQYHNILKLKDRGYYKQLIVEVFKPGDNIHIERELLTTDDYTYPDGTIVCYSVEFTEDIIPVAYNGYYLVAVDLIWCRRNVLFETLPFDIIT